MSLWGKHWRNRSEITGTGSRVTPQNQVLQRTAVSSQIGEPQALEPPCYDHSREASMIRSCSCWFQNNVPLLWPAPADWQPHWLFLYSHKASAWALKFYHWCRNTKVLPASDCQQNAERAEAQLPAHSDLSNLVQVHLFGHTWTHA